MGQCFALQRILRAYLFYINIHRFTLLHCRWQEKILLELTIERIGKPSYFQHDSMRLSTFTYIYTGLHRFVTNFTRILLSAQGTLNCSAFTDRCTGSPLFWAYGHVTHTSTTLYSYSPFPSPAQDSGEKRKYIAFLSSRYLPLLTSKSLQLFVQIFTLEMLMFSMRLYAICTQKTGAHSIAW